MKCIIVTTFVAVALTGCADMSSYNPLNGVQTGYDASASVDEYAGFRQGFEALKVGNYTTAEAQFQSVLAASPNDPYALLGMGVVSERTGRQVPALEYYRAASQYGEVAPLGESLAVNTDTGRPMATIRDLAVYNLSRYEP